jgi:hypothetical protein
MGVGQPANVAVFANVIPKPFPLPVVSLHRSRRARRRYYSSWPSHYIPDQLDGDC